MSAESLDGLSMRRKRAAAFDPSSASRLPVQEQLLIDALPEITEQRVLCTSVGRAQFAGALKEQLPDARVTCHFFDVYLSEQAQQARRQDAGAVSIVCAADLPEDDVDLVALALKASGDAELTHELFQTGHARLSLGGRMLVSTDNPQDKWVHDELRKLFPKVTRRPEKRGVVYLATKTANLKKLKNFVCQFAFRDQGRLLAVVSRPGVFSHRRLDGGARALMNAMEIREGFQVLDIGCGCGAVGLAAACRASGVSVLALDSNARAIEATEHSAALNSLQNISTSLNAEGDLDGKEGTFDIVLGNPPYFSNYQIAHVFLDAGRRALKPGGQLLIVTKTPHWYEEHVPDYFESFTLEPGKNYTIIRAVQGGEVGSDGAA